jgi:hypothetical protein
MVNTPFLHDCRPLRRLNVAGFLLTLLVNYLANALPLNDLTTGELAGRYPNLFTPAGFTFSIWGVIYCALAAYILYQLGVGDRNAMRDMSFLPAIGPWFFVSSLANAGWIFAWHYNRVLLSMVVMLVLLVSLILVYIRLLKRNGVSRQELWFVHVPFSLYLGWISVATIANASVVMVDLGLDGFGVLGRVWTISGIIAAGVAGSLFVRLRGDIAYGLVIVWALAGIVARQLAQFDGAYRGIIVVAALGGAVILGFIVMTAVKKA